MNNTLKALIGIYREMQQELIEVQYADKAAFDAALNQCRAIRREINRLCPESETYNPMEHNIVTKI